MLENLLAPELNKHEQTPNEVTHFNSLYKSTSANGLRQRKVASLIINGEKLAATNLLFDETLPAQASIVKKWTSLLKNKV
ncbi:MAG: hypothetical protein COB62_06910 [Piscirickettsiaceae bacterium]|nr:MAG: hypothetical protein COB62_06910 [Piscirickettsiaceae bacterium]